MENVPDEDDRSKIDEKDFDVLVYGTGICESIIAAAAARIGKKVLHFDRKKYYGGYSATLTYKQIDEMSQTLGSDAFRLIGDEEILLNLKKFSGRYGFDLNPLPLFSSQDMVRLLISSGVGRYLEFLIPEKFYVWNTENKSFTSVPLSKKDIFLSKTLSLPERTRLMMFLKNISAANFARMSETCTTDAQKEGERKTDLVNNANPRLEGRTFEIFFEEVHKLSSQRLAEVIPAIAFQTWEPYNDSQSSLDSLYKRMRVYVSSVGVYGNNPMLYSKYGLGEVSQAFCRVCAVYEGIYMLNHDETPSFEKFADKTIVVSPDYVSKGELQVTEKVLRCILISNTSLLSSREEKDGEPEVSGTDNFVCLIPPSPSPSPSKRRKGVITCVQMGHRSSGIVRKGEYMIHLSCVVECDDDDDDGEGLDEFDRNGANTSSSFFAPVIEDLFASCKMSLEECCDFRAYFALNVRNRRKEVEERGNNDDVRFACVSDLGGDPMMALNYVVEEAKRVFEKLFPGEKMLEMIPDPETVQEEMKMKEDLEKNGEETNQRMTK